jgi:hypothetical protein
VVARRGAAQNPRHRHLAVQEGLAMKNRTPLLVAGVAALSGTAVLAQPHLRPGLWEETVAMKTDNAQANAAMEQMKARLASMPPEQRAAMEKMMASHGMGSAPGGAANVIRVCITKEQVDRGFTPDHQGRCSRTNVSTSGNVTTFEFACKSDQHTVSGKGTFTAMGDTAFTASTVADTVSPKMTMHVQSDMSGKFISRDCGDVKPMETPPAR